MVYYNIYEYHIVNFIVSKDEWRFDNQSDSNEDQENVENVKFEDWFLQKESGRYHSEDRGSGWNVNKIRNL